MRVAYLSSSPRPPRPELDAVVRGMTSLAKRFPGEVEFLYPLAAYLPFVTRSLAGIDRRRDLAQLDRTVDLHLLVSDRLRPYPFLRHLEKPLVYVLATGLGGARRPLLRPAFRQTWRLVVPSDEDREIVARWGYPDAAVIPAGLDLGRFSRVEPPAGDEFVLVAGSAPWTRRQFRTKGVEHLLRAAGALPELRLVFLWRGAHAARMVDWVDRRGLSGRVEVVDRRVDVNEVLARSHASVVLSKSPKLVKAYPDSLLEALSAGRPVIVSRALRMSAFVERHGCGEVVEKLGAEAVTGAIRRLIDGYRRRREGALRAPLDRFSLAACVAAYAEVFDHLLAVSDAETG